MFLKMFEHIEHRFEPIIFSRCFSGYHFISDGWKLTFSHFTSRKHEYEWHRKFWKTFHCGFCLGFVFEVKISKKCYGIIQGFRIFHPNQLAHSCDSFVSSRRQLAYLDLHDALAFSRTFVPNHSNFWNICSFIIEY